MEWKKVKLGEVVSLYAKTITPKKDIMYNLYSLPAFDNGEKEQVLGKSIQSNKFVVPNKCILYNKLNVRFKRVWRIDTTEQNKICSTEFLPLVVNETIVDYQYLYYVLISDDITSYLCGQNTNTSGSHKRIDITDFLNIEVNIPSYKEQMKIGQCLSALDRKIALNRAINHNLEAIAKQLYDYWFVQFDFPDSNGRPYKSSGGEMGKGLPTNWQYGKLRDICRMYQPKTLPINKLNECFKYPVYGANGSIGHYYTYNHEDSQIAMACRGNSCGKINRTLPRSWITGNAMVIQMLDNCVSNEFVKQALKYVNIQGAITGSGQPQLTRENLERVRIVIPDKNIMVKYSKRVQPIIALQIHLITELTQLIALRDKLLPLLMNGQVSVKSE